MDSMEKKLNYVFRLAVFAYGSDNVKNITYKLYTEELDPTVKNKPTKVLIEFSHSFCSSPIALYDLDAAIIHLEDRMKKKIEELEQKSKDAGVDAQRLKDGFEALKREAGRT